MISTSIWKSTLYDLKLKTCTLPLEAPLRWPTNRWPKEFYYPQKFLSLWISGDLDDHLVVAAITEVLEKDQVPGLAQQSIQAHFCQKFLECTRSFCQIQMNSKQQLFCWLQYIVVLCIIFILHTQVWPKILTICYV